MPTARHARGLVAGVVSIAVALVLLAPVRSDIDTATAALVLVFPGVVAAIVGGRVPAVATAVLAAIAFNVVFLRPYGTLEVSLAEEVVSLAVLVVVALTVGTLVAREAERRAAAERRALEVADARAETDRAVAEAFALGLAGEHRAALLRSVSHDLRTPLSTIRAVASDLRDGGGDYDDKTREELLDLVVDEAERLDRLVANLLSLSRVEAGALEADRQAIALDELLDECVHRHARLVRDRKVSVDVPLTLPLVDADWTLVDQAVTNLIANAVRHAPEGSRIWVAARRREPGWVEVRVTDQGAGIPAGLRDDVFQPYRRGPGSASSGIGLAIVRAVADAHGGTVTIEDGPSGGASVSFTLPEHDGERHG
jgi:two-component system, OmpR family, sensor histidine kinase KdpD